ncbi:MAG: hypothetical protein HZC42_08345 [Candidatus Eisenbacteria bacterium]|nr:hypothetical protein [Candidatus Eisenbacteria bacterium]
MAAGWKDWLDELIAAGKKIARDEIVDLVSSAKQDSNEFLRRQGRKLERYLGQLAAGEITVDEFKTLVRQLRTLIEEEAEEMSTRAAVRAQRLTEDITRLILGQLLRRL